MGLTNFRFTKIVTQRIMLIERTIGMVTILTTPRAESTIYNASEKEVCNFVVDYQKERPVQEYIYPKHLS